ncbi:DoxX family protein [Streptomonospora sp. PA3]|uniref:DoxX family protein n=1 Tax=Streptomonospora sp. PA3 TaxID=2607326 RepID=UPI0012DC9368|nr:DoxX family protein [Streptomonospora sp. PA3]MUL40552.1 DoxX family protein [Streptomonospora sp. PA3]
MSDPVSTAQAGSTDAARPRRWVHIALWILQVLTGLFFIFASALPKLAGSSYALDIFERMGAGPGLMYTVGVLELAGGIALMVPVLAALAGICFVGLMIGAFVVQVAYIGENQATPVILGVIVGTIAWGRRRSLVDLARLLRGARS